MNKLQFSANKTLKLTNVLALGINISDEDLDLEVIIERMQLYIKSKGTTNIGPLIQYNKAKVSEDSLEGINIYLLLQCADYIHHVEPPYKMISVVRVPDCLYCRYQGPESRFSVTYDKINVEAFMMDIELDDSNYTIYVSQDDESEQIISDVFVPRKGSHNNLFP